MLEFLEKNAASNPIKDYTLDINYAGHHQKSPVHTLRVIAKLCPKLSA